MLEIKNLSAGYKNKTVINNISCEFHNSEITCILGVNGSGKSTLLKAVMGICDIKNGEVNVDGEVLTGNTKDIAKHVSYLSQNHLFPNLSVERVVLHGRFSHLNYPRKYTKEDIEICRKAMEEAGILNMKDRLASELSGGELQKVFLAQSLASENRNYLFDEPNSFLDIKYQFELSEKIKKLRKHNKCVVAVLHDINLSLTLADKIIVLNSGEIVFSGTPDETYKSGIIKKVFAVNCERITAKNGSNHYILTNT